LREVFWRGLDAVSWRRKTRKEGKEVEEVEEKEVERGWGTVPSLKLEKSNPAKEKKYAQTYRGVWTKLLTYLGQESLRS
jgi:hypothetical protein